MGLFKKKIVKGISGGAWGHLFNVHKIDLVSDSLPEHSLFFYSATSRGKIALENIIKSHISAVEQRRGVSFQVIAEIVSLGDKTRNRKIHDVITKYINRIKDVLVEGVKRGELREDIDPEAASTLFFGMTQGLVNIWTLGQYEFSLQEKYAPLWGIFREAIIKR